MKAQNRNLPDFQIKGTLPLAYQTILTEEALVFLSSLHKQFEPKRKHLLTLRKKRQRAFDRGTKPDFLSETKHIRESSWTIAPIPSECLDRRVEITGPTDRKMMINALNAGANSFMADLEDATSPSWENIIQGQLNLRDAVQGTISYTSPQGKTYSLQKSNTLLMVRPRGWHLDEKHVLMNGQPISASLFDFGLYLYHNSHTLLQKGTRPYFYLPKMESHLEARLWNEVFVFAQKTIGLPMGTCKATVLIETLPAVFELNEILYELKEHILGLNCGRWDYLFSCIKTLRNQPDFFLPERQLLTMTSPFMEAYSKLTIQTCHKRNAQAMGGMAAQIPIKEDEQANNDALYKVYLDKRREALNGHDGTWVAHPALIPIAKEVFDTFMPRQNQLDKKRTEWHITEQDLLSFPLGVVTEKGVRLNIEVSLKYIEAWLRGQGAVPIHHLMEDAATAEISRTQLWHWLHRSHVTLDDGQILTSSLLKQWIAEEVEKIQQTLSPTESTQLIDQAHELLNKLIFDDTFYEFLTVQGYEYL